MTTNVSNKKEMTRQRIISAAGKGIRELGYGGIGVDGIAKEAGVTSGAFYGHFKSKTNVFEATVSSGMKGLVDGITLFQESKGDQWLNAFIDWYLGEEHRQDVCEGCALPGLSSDVVRADKEVHLAYENQLSDAVDVIAKGLNNDNKLKRKKAAWSLLAALAGGITMARAVSNEKLAKEITLGVKQTVKKMLEEVV